MSQRRVQLSSGNQSHKRLRDWIPQANMFFFLFPPTHAFLSQLMLSPFSPGTKAKNYGSSGCPGSYPTVQSLNSRYLSSALFLLPCFRLSFSSIQPNAIFSFPTSYMSPWCFSIPSISSVLGLSTPPPAPSTPWGLPTFSSCLCHGGSCC